MGGEQQRGDRLVSTESSSLKKYIYITVTNDFSHTAWSQCFGRRLQPSMKYVLHTHTYIYNIHVYIRNIYIADTILQGLCIQKN